MKINRRAILGALFFALMFLYVGVQAYFAFVEVGSFDGWSGEQRSPGGPVLITGSDPNGPARFLQAGDVMVAVNGVSPQEDFTVVGLSERVPPGTTYVMTIRRGGQDISVPITTVARKPRNNFGEKAYVFIHLLFIVTALGVFLLKPDDEHAWLLALLLGTFSGLSTWRMPIGFLSPWMEVLVSAAKILSLWSLPLFVRFFLNFPTRSPILRRWPSIGRYFAVPFYFLILPIFGGGRLPPFIRSWYFRLSPIQWLSARNSLGLPLVGAYLLAGLIVLGVSYRAADPVARRRLRVVVFGSGLGFLVYLIAIGAENFDLQNTAPRLAEWIQITMLVTLCFIPVSFAYAIVRHKVIPISLIIRRSARYVLVSHGSAILLMGVVGVIMFFMMDGVFTYLLPVSSRMVGILSALFGIVVWTLAHRVHRQVIAPMIDRKFFREAYDARQILSELSHSVRAATDTRELLEMVATRIQRALHVENVHVLLRNEGSGDFRSVLGFDYRLSEALPQNSTTEVTLAAQAKVIRRLTETGEPLSVDLTDEGSWLAQELDADRGTAAEEERSTLKWLDSALLLPLSARNEMLGLISLGPRLGDQPFSGEDEQMLMSVVTQTVFAMENTQLIQRMIRDERRQKELEAAHEQRAKELAEARQVQLSMLPRKLPKLPGLDVATYMQPATEVGGDYYDFHESADGTLTVAVGDATGHGLKAGTMVTAMKSLFEAFAHQSDVAQILDQSNRALKRMNLRSLFMAMTLIKIKDMRMTVSMAGMPPVLIFRARSGAVEEIAISALPLGSLANYSYKSRDVMLEPEDVVVIMSDGLPERFNSENEMLDYVPTKLAFAASASLSPDQIIAHLVTTGEQWADGRPQDDDVTFVVLKATAGKVAPVEDGAEASSAGTLGLAAR